MSCRYEALGGLVAEAAGFPLVAASWVVAETVSWYYPNGFSLGQGGPAATRDLDSEPLRAWLWPDAAAPLGGRPWRVSLPRPDSLSRPPCVGGSDAVLALQGRLELGPAPLPLRGMRHPVLSFYAAPGPSCALAESFCRFIRL